MVSSNLLDYELYVFVENDLCGGVTAVILVSGRGARGTFLRNNISEGSYGCRVESGGYPWLSGNVIDDSQCVGVSVFVRVSVLLCYYVCVCVCVC